MPPSEGVAVTDETLAALRHELMRLGRRRETGSSVTDLDASAFRILWLVIEHGPHTMRGLAEQLQLEQSTINRQVSAAEAHGWVERHHDPGATAMLVRATAAGETAYGIESEARAEGLRTIVNTLGDRAIADLAGGLARFNDAIDEAIEAAGK
ncbi:DNA-binding MarR family transcriptional regulator [Nocardioides sp. BE266]|uniref:MarR family winged helix-turn-helix transcriptional regulator n=1 Tax=Nocardioides sp. BE266 TaxID=2817725 RepID=UPI00286022D4|nr:MarR family transcriptional regulator [Nocardioides sp. BE266]MDR7255433.1 DNA-binding MarR family transcriptional regulator [Nocardioides sp. BE266]